MKFGAQQLTITALYFSNTENAFWKCHYYYDEVTKENCKYLVKKVTAVSFQNISLERLEAVCEGLKTNTHLENLEMASVAMTDRVAKVGCSVSFQMFMCKMCMLK